MNTKSDNKITQIAVAILFFVFAFALGSWGVDSGSLWHYLGAFVLFVLGCRTIIRTFISHGKK